MEDFLLAFCSNPDNNITNGAGNLQLWFDSFDNAQDRFAHDSTELVEVHPELAEGLIWRPVATDKLK